MNNSGLHLGYLSRISRAVNPYLYHPLSEGKFAVLNQWAWTWYQHTRAPWMSAPGGSVTALIRRIKSDAMFYEYPTSDKIPYFTNKPI